MERERDWPMSRPASARLAELYPGARITEPYYTNDSHTFSPRRGVFSPAMTRGSSAGRSNGSSPRGCGNRTAERAEWRLAQQFERGMTSPDAIRDALRPGSPHSLARHRAEEVQRNPLLNSPAWRCGTPREPYFGSVVRGHVISECRTQVALRRYR